MSSLKQSFQDAAPPTIDIDFHQTLLTLAQGALNDKDLVKAETLLKQVDDQCPPALRKKALLLLSRVYRQRAQYGQMSEPLMRASAEFPHDLAVMKALADWHDLVRNCAVAVELWGEIYHREQHRPNEATYIRYAGALRDNGDIELARRILTEAVAQYPRSSNLYLELAALGGSANCMPDALLYSRNALLLALEERAEKKQYETVRRVFQILSSSFRATDQPSTTLVTSPQDDRESELTSTVCLIVQNESAYILEWISYYQALGFDDILVYDNETTDGSEDLLRALAERKIIKLVHWPNMPMQPAQFAAYEDALSRCTTEWIAFLDIDEFLVLKQHRTIKDFIRQFVSGFSPPVGGVAINWKIFGSGGAREREPGLVIERFTRAGHPKRHGWQVKSIVRRRGARFASNHTCTLRRDFSYVDASGTTYLGRGDACYDVAQVNHYAVKSWSEFMEKTQRGRVNLANDTAAEQFYSGDGSKHYFEGYDQNEYEDREILRHKDAVRERIAALTEALSRPPPQ